MSMYNMDNLRLDNMKNIYNYWLEQNAKPHVAPELRAKADAASDTLVKQISLPAGLMAAPVQHTAAPSAS
jgi:hypothetical protein